MEDVSTPQRRTVLGTTPLRSGKKRKAPFSRFSANATFSCFPLWNDNKDELSKDNTILSEEVKREGVVKRVRTATELLPKQQGSSALSFTADTTPQETQTSSSTAAAATSFDVGARSALDTSLHSLTVNGATADLNTPPPKDRRRAEASTSIDVLEKSEKRSRFNAPSSSYSISSNTFPCANSPTGEETTDSRSNFTQVVPDFSEEHAETKTIKSCSSPLKFSVHSCASSTLSPNGSPRLYDASAASPVHRSTFCSLPCHSSLHLRCDSSAECLTSTPSPRTPVRAESPPPLATPHRRRARTQNSAKEKGTTTPKAPLRPCRPRRNLLHGVLNGNRREVEDALAAGEDPNSPLTVPLWVIGKPNAMLPVLVAARLAYCGVVETLLRYGAVPNSVTRDGQNGLHLLFLHNSLQRTEPDVPTSLGLHSSLEASNYVGTKTNRSIFPVHRTPAWADLENFFKELTPSSDSKIAVDSDSEDSDSDLTDVPQLHFSSRTSRQTLDPYNFDLPSLPRSKFLPASATQPRVPTEREVLLCGEVLLSKGVDANRKDATGRTPKDYALNVYGLPRNHPFISKLDQQNSIILTAKRCMGESRTCSSKNLSNLEQPCVSSVYRRL